MYQYLFILCFVIVILLVLFRYREKNMQKTIFEKIHRQWGAESAYRFNVTEQEKVDYLYRERTAFGQIDDITWNDLSMDHVYEKMNYCFSACGKEYLYYRLRTPFFEKMAIERQREKISYLRQEKELTSKLRYFYRRIGNVEKGSVYECLKKQDFSELQKPYRYIISDLFLLLAFVVMYVSMPLGLLTLLVILFLNINLYFKDKKKADQSLSLYFYLLRLLEESEKLAKVLDQDSVFCSEKMQIAEFSKRIGAVIGKYRYFISMSRSTGASNPIDMILDYIRMFTFVDLISYYFITKKLQNERNTLVEFFDLIGELEALISVSMFQEYQSATGTCQVTFSDMRQIEAQELYHPLIKNPVKNSIKISQPVLLTGANATGKSTFLKAMAINQLFAQTFGFACAMTYHTAFYVMQTSMCVRDDVMRGDSYYLAEIKAMKKLFDLLMMAEQKQIHYFCILDEILRGTNTEERIAGAAELLIALWKKNALCMAATHDMELTQILDGTYEKYYFEEDFDGDDVSFSYKLKHGIATSHNAIRLLEGIGFPKTVTEHARYRIRHFKESGSWIV